MRERKEQRGGAYTVHENVHRPVSPGEPAADVQLSETSLLLDALRTFEEGLQRKALIELPFNDTFHPAWFLAETERNVFLWRKGLSLIDRDRFEFWIDLPLLVEKRLAQLEGFDYENPFMNAHWGGVLPDRKNAEREREYLLSLEARFMELRSHLHALSKVSCIVRDELSEPATERPIIVLLPPSPRTAALGTTIGARPASSDRAVDDARKV